MIGVRIVLSLMPDLEKKFLNFANAALEEGVLPDREKAVASLTTALAIEDSEAVKRSIVAAKQVGITNEEIGQLNAIVISLKALKINQLGGFSKSTNQSSSQSTCCR